MTFYPSAKASTTSIKVIGSPDDNSVQDWIDNIQSSGVVSGFELTNTRTTMELDVAAGTGMIKIADAVDASTRTFEYAGATNITLTQYAVNYIYVDYNGGTPVVLATTNRSTISLNTMFTLGRVYKNTADMHILSAGIHITNIIREEHERLLEKDGFTYVSGAVTTKVATLDLAVSAGVWYFGMDRLTTGALNTTTGGTFEYTHKGVSAWIVDNATASAVNAIQYATSGTDALQNLTVNAYGTQWVYVTSDAKYYVKYGGENGTLAAATAAGPPDDVHPYLGELGELIAKIIVRQTGVIISIETTQTSSYQLNTPSNHNDLGGLNTGDYVHLTATNHTDLTDSGSTTLHSHSNVAVSQLANGTDGELITWSAAGAPTTVAVGTATQVLTSGGVGVAPTFQTLGLDTFTAGENVVAGNLCYLKADGKMWKADASAAATANTLLSIATDTINAAASGIFRLTGKYTTSGLTAGAIQYVSETAAAITETAPVTSAAIVRIVGYALSTTVLYFNPDNTFIEVA